MRARSRRLPELPPRTGSQNPGQDALDFFWPTRRDLPASSQEFFVREHDPQYPGESGPTMYGVVRDFTVIAGEALLKSAMTARGVAHLEHAAGLDPQCRGQALQQVQFDTPGPVVLQVIDRGLADAHKLGQLDLGQPSFVPERLDAELYGAHGPNIRRGGLLTTTHRRSTLQ